MGEVEKILSEEIAQIERRLEASPDYRRLKVLRKTLAELVAIGATPRASTVTYGGGEPRPLSVPSAVIMALDEAGAPLSTRNLLEEVEKRGKRVGGQTPVNTLSNTLSQDPRFKSVIWNGGRGWWFTDRALPVGDVI